MVTLIVVGCVAVLLYLVKLLVEWYIEDQSRRALKFTNGEAIPGTRYRFPFGDFGEFIQGGRHFAEENFKKYGDVYKIWICSTPFVVVANSDYCKTVYSHQLEHKKCPEMFGYPFKEFLGDCLGVMHGAKWRSVRAVFQRLFDPSNTQDFIEMFANHCEQALDQSGIFNLYEKISSIPFTAIAKHIYGDQVDNRREKLLALSKKQSKLMMESFRGKWSKYSIINYFQKGLQEQLMDYKIEWKQFNIEMLQADKNSLANILYDYVNEGTITESEFLQTLDEILFANIDVVAGVISWTLLEVSPDKDICSRIRKEYQENTHDLQSYIRKSGTLIDMVVKEAARLRPVSPYSLPEVITTKKKIFSPGLPSFTLPKNTTICVDNFSLNTHPSRWDDPYAFKPERFLQDSHQLKFNRFGMGQRKCIGQLLGDAMTKLFLCIVLSKYHINILNEASHYEQATLLAPNTMVEFLPINKK